VLNTVVVAYEVLNAVVVAYKVLNVVVVPNTVDLLGSVVLLVAPVVLNTVVVA